MNSTAIILSGIPFNNTVSNYWGGRWGEVSVSVKIEPAAGLSGNVIANNAIYNCRRSSFSVNSPSIRLRVSIGYLKSLQNRKLLFRTIKSIT